jgi:hypothetical protein
MLLIGIAGADNYPKLIAGNLAGHITHAAAKHNWLGIIRLQIPCSAQPLQGLGGSPILMNADSNSLDHSTPPV